MAETDTEEVVVDFGKICRLCLTEDGVLISLYSTDSVVENRIKSIPDKILDLMAIKVAKDDGFPSWICHNCLSQVDKCSEFFDMCRSSQFTLNDSYFKALSDAGVNISTVKTLMIGGETKNFVNNVGNQKDEKLEIQIENSCMINDTKEEYSTLESIKNRESKSEISYSKKYFCRDCAKIFINRDEFLIHRISVHHDDLVTETMKLDEIGNKVTGLWTCDACDIKFDSRNAISTHIKCSHVNDEKKEVSHSSLRQISCKYCGSSYVRKHTAQHLELVHKLSKKLYLEQIYSFDCKICYRPFMRQASLRNHIEKFHSESIEIIAEAENCDVVWKCSECDSLFSEEVFLMQHYGSKHSKYPVEIDSLRVLKSKSLICHCGAVASNNFDADLHNIFYHKKESNEDFPLECPACYDIFNHLDDLKRHLVAFHLLMSTGFDNECTFCCKKFGSSISLIDHLRLDHDIASIDIPHEENVAGDDLKVSDDEEKLNETENDIATEAEAKEICLNGAVASKSATSVFVCEYCGVCYDNEEDLQSHGNECHATHICYHCGKIYKSDVHLKRHVMEFHSTISPIKCPLCPKVFPRKMNLHNHYKRRHLKQTKKFVCSYCGISLKGKVALRSHEDRLHRNIRSYKCSECPEAFTTRSILRKHAQRHLAVRPMLQCKYCEREFSTISGIERHVKTHEGVKDFVCDRSLCGKAFYTKSELNRHIKFHTKDFRHICSVCNHKFMSPGELKKHSTKHTGERPFKCHLCSCAYARRDDKVKHLKRVHNLKVKRVYGKPLRKYSDENADTVDTIVVDEECSTEIDNPEDVVYTNVNIM